LGASNIRVAEYLAHIPDTKVLQAQLHRAVVLARERATQDALAVAEGVKPKRTRKKAGEE
jgi:hypothetical protein